MNVIKIIENINENNYFLISELYEIKIPKNLSSKESILYIKTILKRYDKILNRKNIKKPDLYNNSKLNLDKLKLYTDYELIHYFNLDEDIDFFGIEELIGNILKERDITKAQKILNRFAIDITGARDGENIYGIASVTKNCLITVKGIISPYKKSLDELRLSPLLWKKFLKKLNKIPFFESLSDFEKQMWLIENEKDKKDITDLNGFEIKIINTGESDLIRKLSENDLKSIIDNYLDANIVLDLFPKKAGSKARKQSLFFINSFWRIFQDYQFIKKYEGYYLDIESGLIRKNNISSNKKYKILEYTSKIVFYFENNDNVKSEDQHFEFLSNHYDIDINDMYNIKEELSFFTAGGLKSLLQKIIRFRPMRISKYDYKTCIITVCILLFLNKGSFVPDIQRFVTGKESFFKRLAVSIYEDSYIKNENILNSLLMSALLSQKVKNWYPSDNLLVYFLDAAIESVESDYYYEYSTKRMIEPSRLEDIINKKNTVYELSGSLLYEVKSFQNDINMIYNIESHIESYIERPKNMEFYHAIDQHWMPDIVYYYPEKLSPDVIFKNMWIYSSGINTRKRIFDESNEIYKKIKTCQKKSYFIKKYDKSYLFYEYDNKLNIRMSISNEYISGMIGSVYLTTKGIKTINTISSDTLKDIVSIRNPSREMKEAKLSDDTILNNQILINDMINNKNIKMNKIKLPYPNQYKNIIFFNDDIIIDNNIISIDEFKNYSFNIPIINSKYMKNFDPFIHDGDFIFENSFIKLEKYISKKDQIFINRVIFFLGQNDNIIKLISVNRSGESNAFRIIDFDIFEFLIKLCKWFPILIKKTEHKLIQFEIKFLGFMNYIVKNYLSKLNNIYNKWNIHSPDIILWKHQIDTIESMIKNHKKSKKGHFMWIPVGMGKCVDPYTEILTYNRNVILAKDIKLYDVLIDDTYSPTIVLNTCEGYSDMYEIEQSNGMNYKVNEFHILTLFDTKSSSIKDISIKDCIKNIDDYMGINVNNTLSKLKIRNVGFGKYFGFTLNGSGRFLLKDGTITHNTQITLNYIKWLNDNNELPPHIIYTLPDSAIQNTIVEANKLGFNIEILYPLKSKKETYHVKYNYLCEPNKYHLSLIEHDHLRLCPNLNNYEYFLVVDEVHKTLNDTKRTNHALDLSYSSKEFIIQTGTALIDNNIYKLIQWLKQITDFEINENNFWVAINNMINKKINTGVKEIDLEIEFDVLDKRYYDLLPISIGGKNKNANQRDIRECFNICYDLCINQIILETERQLKSGNRVFIVANNKQHQKYIYDKIKSNDKYLLENGKSIFLTKDLVDEKLIEPYNVVITTKNYSAGYTLTYLNVMITSVYPSNNATRDQLRGRINRIGQKEKEIYYITVHCGILSYLLQHHKDAKNLESVIKSLAEEIKL